MVAISCNGRNIEIYKSNPGQIADLTGFEFKQNIKGQSKELKPSLLKSHL